MTELVGWSYLACLVISLSGLALADWRLRLAFFRDWRRSLRSLLPVYVLLLAWDVLGIGLGIFFIGDSRFDSGIVLAPELPLEEPFFLALLIYVTLIFYLLLARLSRPRSRQS